MNATGHSLKTVCFAFWLQTAPKGAWKPAPYKGQVFTNCRSNRSKDDLDLQSDAMAKSAIKMRQSSSREGRYCTNLLANLFCC